MAGDFDFVSSVIEDQKSVLQKVSREIWENPERRFQEHKAHELLTNVLGKYGFEVQKRYLLDTAFRAEFHSQNGSEPTVAILLEYDALPEIGHACGHNLIAEAGLAAGIAVKAAMEKDPSISGKLVLMGTPAEEGGAGKVKLLNKGAFEGIDAAMMAHPANKTCIFPPILCVVRGTIEYLGKEAHAAAYPWEGVNALDAAVSCYCSISMLRQHIKPSERIHAIITDGGVATNIIPGRAKMEISIRSPNVGSLNKLKKKVEECIKGASVSSGCTVNFAFDEEEACQNVLNNKVLGNIFGEYFPNAGTDILSSQIQAGSTDMGNVSHAIPSIHPFYAIPTEATNHTKPFTEAAGSPGAQGATLAAGKALAMTALTLLRNPEVLRKAKDQFLADLAEDLKSG